jgi:hypothetical protein
MRLRLVCEQAELMRCSGCACHSKLLASVRSLRKQETALCLLLVFAYSIMPREGKGKLLRDIEAEGIL